MKKNMSSKLRRVMATMMMACMLLTVATVSSNAEAGIMPCGETAEIEEKRELL